MSTGIIIEYMKKKLDHGEKSKTEYFFEYLHAKPMTSCALLMSIFC